MTTVAASSPQFITTDQLLKHWQGHRDLTRRMIEAFPDDHLFTFTIGGMRTFADLAKEFIRMSVPTVQGIATGNWDSADRTTSATSKAHLFALWDQDTATIK